MDEAPKRPDSMEEGKSSALADSIAALAQEKLGSAGRVFVRREIRKLEGKLAENEQVLNLARGQYLRKDGLIVLTDRRVLFVEEGMVRSRLEDFPYDKITSVRTGTKMVHGEITIFVAGNSVAFSGIRPKERAVEVGEYVRQRISAHLAVGEPRSSEPAPAIPSPASPAPPDAGSTTMADPATRLTKLAKLREEGLISDEEYEAQRQRILAEL